VLFFLLEGNRAHCRLLPPPGGQRHAQRPRRALRASGPLQREVRVTCVPWWFASCPSV